MEKSVVENIVKQSKAIEGWLSREAALLIGALDTFQKSLSITGDIFEIGVHHGKSAVLLNNLLQAPEMLHICDIFDSQENNVSGSGSGSRAIFEANLQKYSNQPLGKIHACLSTDLTPDRVGKKRYRIFHIDGGHNKDEALADLTLAALCIMDQGILIVDDPFRYEWPGVTEAIIEFLQTHQEFTSIVVGFNKLILARKIIAEQYKAFLDNASSRSRFGLVTPISYKQLPFAGGQLRIFFIPSYVQNQRVGLVSKVIRKIKGSFG